MPSREHVHLQKDCFVRHICRSIIPNLEYLYTENIHVISSLLFLIDYDIFSVREGREVNNRLTGWAFAHLVNYFAHPVN